MKIHSDEAWKVASYFSDVLASDTRTLAAMIDSLLEKEREAHTQIVNELTHKLSQEIESRIEKDAAIKELWLVVKSLEDEKSDAEDDFREMVEAWEFANDT